MFDAKTPEAAAYIAQREATQKYQLRIWHRVALGLAAALTVSVGTTAYSANLVHEIRSTQVANATVAQCQVKTFDAILKDVRLAFAGDKKASDYAKAPRSC